MSRQDTSGRDHDLVLYGATGFAGALTAEYLARHAPEGCRWALAGRSTAKLERLRDQLATLNPDCAGLPLLRADSADAGSLRALAASTRVLATTVGPYLRHGEPLVAACAEAGTDYLDLTGEAEFVDRTYLRHDATARATGARLVHACGFDSVPYDLGVHYTVGLLPKGVPLRIDGFVRTDATFSGGTLSSTLTAASRPAAMARAARARRRVEPQPAGRTVRAPFGPPVRSRDTGTWGLPLPTLDPQVVARSAAALDQYGPDFRYRHFAGVRRLPTAVAATAGAGALAALAQVPPVRRWLSGRLQPGEGPSPQRRARSWFAVRFVASGGGAHLVTEVRGGDPGYDETAKMLAEGALSLAFDDLPDTAGQVTTAVAMGDALTRRLQDAGIVFRVVRG
ncbi:saccharopine dehydrogenase [Streptomyces noursei ZPM]|uniref:Saccharopine dehydrogenase n=1 Tax=Streptomyces noursei TaxID=1971 RepID=A0A401RBC4_STRNR|nr:saccharopine dehydrogenase NADP-binding domain-containing protein [Streptomyces noursei]AKA07021.1 saccharopine dehydrogenase [Streptomyces noursei ZPM]EOT01516.1 saccharopine dehydrogenase [Streptomyces noursei CCRC 11814]EXU91906.1 saccharopine dehydrogenase [Streptomyces noursei PD-1]UWS75575.1 saccharopine dehydrogenase NADP-binding domain-containing protein [Streptomyces noursei]GCB94897.1 saccharopine dehydrogenase [Streptomyces noursei]